MAYSFPGGGGTERLTGTIAAPAANMSVGCWINLAVIATGRSICGCGTTDANFSGLMTSSSVTTRLRFKINLATTDVVVEWAAPTIGTWTCVVCTFPTNTNAANSLIYHGTISSPMALQTHSVDTNGSGAVSMNTTGSIGKNGSGSTGFQGSIFAPFMIPAVMTADEAERYRQGDWSVIYRNGTPAFFLPLRGGDTEKVSLGGSTLLWTTTGSPTNVEDPPIQAGWAAGLLSVHRQGPIQTPKSVDGGITPVGTLAKSDLRTAFGGGATPSGAVPKTVQKSLAGAFT